MTWRYLPAPSGFGKKAVDEAVTFPSENIFTEVLRGEGSIKWNKSSWEQNPTQYQIINTLEAFPVLEYLPATVTKGSANIFLPKRWTRALA